MTQYTDLIVLFVGITIVFFVALFSKKSTIFITFLLRIILCGLIIYFANMGFENEYHFDRVNDSFLLHAFPFILILFILFLVYLVYKRIRR